MKSNVRICKGREMKVHGSKSLATEPHLNPAFLPCPCLIPSSSSHSTILHNPITSMSGRQPPSRPGRSSDFPPRDRERDRDRTRGYDRDGRDGKSRSRSPKREPRDERGARRHTCTSLKLTARPIRSRVRKAVTRLRPLRTGRLPRRGWTEL